MQVTPTRITVTTASRHRARPVRCAGCGRLGVTGQLTVTAAGSGRRGQPCCGGCASRLAAAAVAELLGGDAPPPPAAEPEPAAEPVAATAADVAAVAEWWDAVDRDALADAADAHAAAVRDRTGRPLDPAAAEGAAVSIALSVCGLSDAPPDTTRRPCPSCGVILVPDRRAAAHRTTWLLRMAHIVAWARTRSRR